MNHYIMQGEPKISALNLLCPLPPTSFGSSTHLYFSPPVKSQKLHMVKKGKRSGADVGKLGKMLAGTSRGFVQNSCPVVQMQLLKIIFNLTSSAGVTFNIKSECGS